MSNQLKMSMQLPCVSNIETMAHCGLDKFGELAGINVDKIEVAKLLANEAINNAVEHAKSSNQQVRVEISLKEDTLSIYVRDYGKGFNVDNIKEPKIEEKISGSNKRGWGLKLMENLSDEYNIESGEYGTKIHIYLKITNE